MQDLFSHEAQTNDRDRSLTTAIIDRALAEGYSVRIQDAHGDNKTLTTRSRQNLLNAVGHSRETTFHIINMKAVLGKNVGQVTVYHGEEADRITAAQARTEAHVPFMDSITAPAAEAEPAPILDEIAEYSDQLTAEADRRETIAATDPEAQGGFPSWINRTEAAITNKLITAIKKRKGYRMRVYDGEEWATGWTANRKTIQSATAQTEHTVIHVQDDRRKNIGFIALIHGNGEDLISDAGWNRNDGPAKATIEALCEEANQ